MRLTAALTNIKFQDSLNNWPQYHCHWREMSFLDSLTCIDLLSQSFTASFKVNKARCLSPSIDSWGKQWPNCLHHGAIWSGVVFAVWEHLQQVNSAQSFWGDYKIFNWLLIDCIRFPSFSLFIAKCWYYSSILKYSVYNIALLTHTEAETCRPASSVMGYSLILIFFICLWWLKHVCPISILDCNLQFTEI